MAADSTTDDRLKRLQKFLGLSDKGTGEKHGGKRSRSPTVSESGSNEVGASNRSKDGDAYISPTKIARIFRNKVTPETLCQLSAMLRGTPSEVRKLVPDASVDQICKMCELWERPDRSLRVRRSRTRSSKRKPRHSKRRRRSSTKSPSRSSHSKVRVSKPADTKVKCEVEARESAFPVPTPKDSE